MVDTEIVIIGCGPVGALAAAMLGKLGRSAVVLEKSTQPNAETRAIHMDHETVRILHSVCERAAVAPFLTPFNGMEFVDATLKRIFLLKASNPESGEQGFMFDQPGIEGALRAQLGEGTGVELRLGCTVTAIENRNDHVLVRFEADGIETTLTARYAIGADGPSSFVRKALGIPLENLDFDEPWVVIDGTLLVDKALPAYGQQVCDIARPKTFIPGVGAHRRWELMVLPGEARDAVMDDDFILRAIELWGVERGAYRIDRKAYYVFHALIAQAYRKDRVFLIGDAAHQTPPFMGQGMCAGFRDAANLVWKLDLVLGGLAADALLDSYQAERAPHVRVLINAAMAQGRLICTIDKAMENTRAEVLAGLASQKDLGFYDGIPGLTGDLRQSGATQEVIGQLSPQPQIRGSDGARSFLDDITGTGFRLLSTERLDPAAWPRETADFWAALKGRCCQMVQAGTAAPLPDDAEDLDGRVTRLLAENGAAAVLIRPDHHIFGVATAAAAVPALLNDLRTQLDRVA
ncbi:MAG: bifunctional 3-(3-hydroxy-phenyl)propionate/3-hydroxycinnamic acid hydroxylase [Pseudomonadota bacterium]